MLVSDNKNIAICSGSTRTEIDIALSKIESGSLKKYFNTIISADDVSEGKPSPEGYLKTAKQLGLNPKQCVAIEDSSNGIKAAKAANMQAIAFLPEGMNHEKYSCSDYVVHSFNELIITDAIE